MKILKITASIFLIVTIQILPQTDSSKAYISACEALQKKDTTNAITLFKVSIKLNEDAPSYYELAKIYSGYTKYKDFISAMIYINKAVEKNGKNIEYKLLQAYLKEELFYSFPLNKTYRNEAITIYEDIVKADSTCERAWFNLGRLYKEDYMKYMNSEYFDQIRDRATTLQGQALEPRTFYTNSPAMKAYYRMKGSTSAWEAYDKFMASLPKPSLKYTRIAFEMFSKSENAYLRSIDITKNEESFIELIELYVMGEKFDKAIELFKKYLNPVVDPVRFYLVGGMTNYLAGNIELAENDYKKAINFMNMNEKEIYTIGSFKKLLKKYEADSINNSDKEFVEKYFNKYMQDHDPLFLTDYNERLLEHYTRVTYSNLLFSAKRLSLEGWKTDRGEVVIRYGIPHQIKRMRAILSASGEQMETETFYYPERTFSFYDMTRRGRYVFNEPSLFGGFVSQSLDNTADSIITYRKNKPEDYIPKFLGPFFYTPFSSYQLKSNQTNKTDIFFSFLINPKDSTTQKDFFDEGYTTGIYLFDKNRNKVSEKISNFKKLTSNTKLTINNLLIGSSSREGNIAFEILRKKDNGVFSYHDKLNVKKYSDKDFAISDLVMCFDVGSTEYTSYIKRNNIYLLPNASNYFNQSMPMFIYYEIYNLSFSTNNSTDFEQKITIQKKEEGGVLSSILSVVGLDKKGEKVSLTSRYRTPEQDPQMYLQLDMSKYDEGEYLITVTIKDNVNGKETSNSTTIIWK